MARQVGVPAIVVALNKVDLVDDPEFRPGLVGLFVVPVVGLPLGFVLGVFVAELLRVRSTAAAWTATKEALKGTGLAVLIGFTTAVLATAVWAAVAVTT